jgi:hypothetical protein
MSPTKKLICIALLGTGLAACGASKDASADKAPPTRAGEGRPETAGIRNTENIGYAGNAIGKKVDSVLDANDKAVQELDKKIDASEQAN